MKVKVEGKYKLLELETQGEVVFQQPIAAVNVIHIHEKDKRVMPKVAPTQLLSSILQRRHPFLEIFHILLDDRKRIKLKKLKVFGTKILQMGRCDQNWILA
jgi:hypothetical protein